MQPVFKGDCLQKRKLIRGLHGKTTNTANCVKKHRGFRSEITNVHTYGPVVCQNASPNRDESLLKTVVVRLQAIEKRTTHHWTKLEK